MTRANESFAQGMSFRRPFFFLLVDSLLELEDWEEAGVSFDVLAACVVVPPAVLSAAWLAGSPAETGCVPSEPAAGWETTTSAVGGSVAAGAGMPPRLRHLPSQPERGAGRRTVRGRASGRGGADDAVARAARNERIR